VWPEVTVTAGNQIRATRAAVAVTTATRRYCINATSRTSAPYDSAISTMADAAPGAKPHTAVVPGNTWRRIISQPSTALARITAQVTSKNTGQPAATLASADGFMLAAIRQPSTPCPKANPTGGTLSRMSRVENTIPAAMHPSNTAAGKCTAVNSRDSARLTGSNAAQA
jgi:hypothetical protein